MRRLGQMAWSGQSFESIYEEYIAGRSEREAALFARGDFLWYGSDLHHAVIAWAYWREIDGVKPTVDFYSASGEVYQIKISSLLQFTEYFDRALKRFAQRDAPGDSFAVMTPFPVRAIEACYENLLEGRPVPEEVQDDVAELRETYQLLDADPLMDPLMDPYDEIFEGDDGLVDDEEAEKDPPKVLLHNDKLYRRRKWHATATKRGWYYLCSNHQKCGCKGSVFVNTDDEVSTLSEHSPECTDEVTEQRSFMFEDAEFLSSLKRHRNANPGKSPCMIIQEFLECHPEFLDNFNRHDLESLVDLLGDAVSDSFDPPRYGKASAFVRMDIFFAGLHIMVLGSDDMLAFSQSVDWLLFDGTFKCVPKPFYQLVTVLGCSIQTRKFVPIVHFLLPSKTQATYRAMFEILDTLTTFDCVNRITADFEKGLQNEILLWLSRNQMEATLHGCRFHFVQALRKKMKALYGRLIDKDVKVKTILHLITWLPFLERDVCENLLMELNQRKTGIEKFLRYFGRFWMPRYDEWSISDDRRTTNNAIESYHSVLSEAMSKHPSISRFLMNLSIIDDERVRNAANPSRQNADTVPVCDEILYQFQEALTWFPMSQHRRR